MQIFSKYFIKKNFCFNSQHWFNRWTSRIQTVKWICINKVSYEGLTKSFANEMSDYKIRANVVSPGFTKTSYYSKFKKKKSLFKWTLSRIPMKRWAEPKEISSLICFLLSNESSYITGENIKIDGGWTNA